MGRPAYGVNAYFTLANASNVLILDDPVRGLLDSAYVLGGDIATPLAGVRSISINRGVSRTFDQTRAGTCTIEIDNSLREFDPLYAPGPYFGNLKPGKRFDVNVAGVTVFSGNVESCRLTYSRNRVPIAVFTIVDNLAWLATKTLSSSWAPTAGQLAGARLGALLDRPEVAFGSARALDAGASTLQADTIEDGTNALVYAQLVARSDFGRFFAARNGPLAYRDRRSNLNTGPQVTFINDGSGVVFGDVERTQATDQLWNRVSAARRGGTTQVFDDLDSQDEYGILAAPDDIGLTDLIVDTDAQAYDYGLYLVTNYSTPEDRFASFTVKLWGLDAAGQASVAALDIGSLVRGVWTAGGVGAPIDRYCVVEGMTWQIARNSCIAQVFVGDAVNRSAFILDDPIFGVLDGPGVLVF